MPRKIRYSIYRWKRPRWEAALCGKHPSFGDVDIVLSFHLILHATSGNFWDWENTIQINWGTPKGKLFNTCLVLARRLMYISLHEPASHGRKIDAPMGSRSSDMLRHEPPIVACPPMGPRSIGRRWRTGSVDVVTDRGLYNCFNCYREAIGNGSKKVFSSFSVVVIILKGK